MIFWLTILGYFSISAVTYVKILPGIYRRKLKQENKEYPGGYLMGLNERNSREAAVFMSAWRALLWVYPLLFEAPLRKMNAYVWKPITEEEERIARLKEDRNDWYGKSLNNPDPETRRMARDIVKVLDDVLKREGVRE